MFLRHLVLSCALLAAPSSSSAESKVAAPWFGIRIVDEATGRGVPLMELRTTNEVRFFSDNAGWIAFHEPGLMGRETWFHVSGPGYDKEKDGFGFSGLRLTPVAGQSAEVKVKRRNIAERTGRLTGQGLFRDSALLGLPCPVENLNPSGVLGQDSVQAVPWRGRIFWLWGDTKVASYPLGNYHTTSATSALPAKPEQGIAFDYFMDKASPDKLRRMMPTEAEGVMWMFGLLTMQDAAGKEQLFAHYGRHPGLAPPVEEGLAKFNETAGVFESVYKLPKAKNWQQPLGHAVRVTAEGGDWFYFTSPLPHTRVKATAADVQNPSAYEALTFDESSAQWQWQRTLPPTTQEAETKLLAAGKLKPQDARFQITDAASGKSVRAHGGSMQWNAWRKRWVLIFVQGGNKEDPSPLGEVWYAESLQPDGPWQKAVKIVTHPRYSYYNPIHHGFLDAEGGRVIYFEGTYTAEFSGNPVKTPRYDYNQLMYRLDLSDPALAPAQSK